MLSVSVFHLFPPVIPMADSARGKADGKRRTEKKDRHGVTGGYLPGRTAILHTLFQAGCPCGPSWRSISFSGRFGGRERQKRGAVHGVYLLPVL